MKSRTLDNLETVNRELEHRAPQEILAYAMERVPPVVLACSFGAEDVVLADMLFTVYPDASLFYLDTDFLFAETYEVRDRLVAKYNIPPERARQIKPELTPEEQAQQYGDALWTTQPDRCCNLRKIAPLKRALAPYAAWITGIRREQSPTRAQAPVIEWDDAFQLVKVNPLATWSWEQVWSYIHAHEVPYNRLHEQNYPSIGCTHCTMPVMPGDDPRSGRWKNFAKTECGLHPPEAAGR